MTEPLPTSATTPATASRRDRFAGWLGAQALPVGFLVLLTGMFWAGDRTLYHKLFYWLLAFPAFVVAIVKPSLPRDFVRSPIGLPVLAFSAYTLLSILWSGTDDSLPSLLTRPLHVWLLFVAVIAIHRLQPARLRQALVAATLVALITAAVSLALFALEGGERLSGYGALYNPLLTSHVFGFFLALVIAAWVRQGPALALPFALATALLALVIVATGSRTPLVGIAAVVVWLVALLGGRRGGMALTALIGCAAVVAGLWPELLTSRGFSFRPQIWSDALRQIAEAPWFGHGFDHPLEIRIEGTPDVFRDPHNMLLAVLYHEGLAGLGLWIWLYAAAGIASWRHRRHALVLVCSATLIYGLAASMTEGGSFLSRPKEHWFLIWIPFALLAASTLEKDNDVPPVPKA